MLVTLEEAKRYLRVDSSDDDQLVSHLIESAETMVLDICRMTVEEIEAGAEVMKTAELYALTYLYEHREEADYKGLTETLKYLLFAVRKEDF